jgi:hypothetical protein
MGVLHHASRSISTVALLALAAGCSGDSTAPDAPFSPGGTSADIAAVNESFDSPAVESYASASVHIGAVVGGSAAAAVRAAPSGAFLRGDRASALRYARSLSRSFGGSGLRPSLSTSASARIPQEYLGVTFVWDVETNQYVPSDDPGAPSNGVRFILYAVNPVTGQPIEPLVPIDGYVDIRLTETTTSGTYQIVVVSSDVTYLEYNVVVGGSSSSIDVRISGFATNGEDRVNFNLDNRLTGTEAAGLTLTVDYELVVPTRGGFLLDLESSITGIGTDTPSGSVDLLARGDNGTVSIEGTQTDASGSYEVEVNGELFATISVSGTGETVIAGADGQPLTAEERAALEDVFAMFGGGFNFFTDLTNPLLSE